MGMAGPEELFLERRQSVLAREEAKLSVTNRRSRRSRVRTG